MSTPARAGAGRRPGAAPPSPETVVLLQSVRSYPSVSLLATTAPGPRMSPGDGATLRRLAADAADRLRAEGLPSAAPVLRALEEAVERALAGPTGRAVAVFVNAAMQKVLRLPVPVPDRVVVDPTFATRDLVRALHRTPRHVVLLLSEREARLFDGTGDRLVPAPGSGFPVTAQDTAGSGSPAAVSALLRRVDAALGSYLRSHPAPLVLVGAERTLAAFRAVSRNTGRLAGTVTGSHTSTPLPELVPRIREVLERYLLSRQQEALAVVERRRSRQRVVDGVAAAWLAARTERPEMLAVEEGYVYPARISEDGDFLLPAGDADHPDVVDDAVDELIELVIRRGGWVAFVADGALAAHDRVALALR